MYRMQQFFLGHGRKGLRGLHILTARGYDFLQQVSTHHFKHWPIVSERPTTLQTKCSTRQSVIGRTAKRTKTTSPRLSFSYSPDHRASADLLPFGAGKMWEKAV